MSALDALFLLGAGLWAGAVNTIVGSGSLVTFPVLIGIGVSPFIANVSNNVGLTGGNVSAVIGYRRELSGQAKRLSSLIWWSIGGGILGSVALLLHPASFARVVPYLVLVGVVLVIAQPRLARYLASRGPRAASGGIALRLGLLLCGAYGGYFGAAQGVIVVALLAVSLEDDLQRLNGLKNALVGSVNAVATIAFVIAAPVDWAVAGLIAISSVIGGQIGARYGRRLPPNVLRVVIIVGGIVIAIRLLVAGS